jgi:replicative DNA helicase
MVTPQHKTILHNRLVIEHNRQIWAPQNDHDLIWRACQQANAGIILLDSTKDVADGPLKDEPAAKAFMDAIQVCIANDVEVLMLHHPRKGNRESTGQEESIDGVYGSTWFTAGSGSVLLVDGEGGSGTLTIKQLKAPATFTPKMNVVITYDTGHLERTNRIDLADMLERKYPTAVKVKEIASYLTGKNTDDLETSDIEKARREANKLVEYGQATKIDGTPATYQWEPGYTLGADEESSQSPASRWTAAHK